MWSAAIPTGGRARRFGGRGRSAFVVDGRSIRERQITEMLTLTTDILIVGSPLTAARDALAGAGRVVADRVPGSGPLGGFHTACCEAHGDAIIVIACDMPYVSASFLGHLLALTRDADAVVPRTERGYHPLCAACTRACLAPAAARLAQGRLKMIDLFDDIHGRLVTAGEIDAFGHHARLLTNVNTPADDGDLEAFQQL